MEDAWLLEKHKIAPVPHGFRSWFRDWAGEETDHPREVIEAALAHVVRNKVEAAYARSDLFERRRILMEDWSRYLPRRRRRIRSLHDNIGLKVAGGEARSQWSKPRDECAAPLEGWICPALPELDSLTVARKPQVVAT